MTCGDGGDVGVACRPACGPSGQPGWERAAEAARWYRRRRFNPLPSCPERGHPPFAYAAVRDEGCGPGTWRRWPLGNVQVATGCRWNLIVIDLDGLDAIGVWGGWCRGVGLPTPASRDAYAANRGCPITWEVTTPSGGRHLWFSTPGLSELPKAIFWRGPGRHSMIELLGDRCLAKAPPSYRVIGGERVSYRWAPGRSPRDIAGPAPLPDWVLGIVAPSSTQPGPSGLPGPGEGGGACPPPQPAGRLPGDPMPAPDLTLHRKAPGCPVAARYDDAEVLASVTDKAALAASWGLRLASSSPNARGWLRARALGREDTRPSAGFHVGTGYYCEPEVCRHSLFELGAILGPYDDWRHCRSDLARRHNVPPLEERRYRAS